MDPTSTSTSSGTKFNLVISNKNTNLNFFDLYFLTSVKPEHNFENHILKLFQTEPTHRLVFRKIQPNSLCHLVGSKMRGKPY